jgi:hypothetical protein
MGKGLSECGQHGAGDGLAAALLRPRDPEPLGHLVADVLGHFGLVRIPGHGETPKANDLKQLCCAVRRAAGYVR